jgi:hypothetical protein
MFEERE